jgi:hypothetical protein
MPGGQAPTDELWPQADPGAQLSKFFFFFETCVTLTTAQIMRARKDIVRLKTCRDFIPNHFIVVDVFSGKEKGEFAASKW